MKYFSKVELEHTFDHDIQTHKYIVLSCPTLNTLTNALLLLLFRTSTTTTCPGMLMFLLLLDDHHFDKVIFDSEIQSII